MQRLLDQDPTVVDSVKPDEYFFRIFIEMETGDPRLAGVVNGGMWIGSAARKGSEGKRVSLRGLFQVHGVPKRQADEWMVVSDL